MKNFEGKYKERKSFYCCKVKSENNLLKRENINDIEEENYEIKRGNNKILIRLIIKMLYMLYVFI